MLLEMLDNVCLPYLSQSNKICTYNAMCMSELYLLNDFQGELVLVMYDSVCLCVCVLMSVKAICHHVSAITLSSSSNPRMFLSKLSMSCIASSAVTLLSS